MSEIDAVYIIACAGMSALWLAVFVRFRFPMNANFYVMTGSVISPMFVSYSDALRYAKRLDVDCCIWRASPKALLARVGTSPEAKETAKRTHKKKRPSDDA